DAKQNGQILPRLRHQRRFSSGMKRSFAAHPVEALDLVDQDCAFYIVELNRQCEWIWLASTRERTNDRKATGAVIALVSKHKSGTPFRLFTPDVRIEVDNGDVAGLRNICGHHSTRSLPTSVPTDISP